jgi:formyl-CoA transferase/CoA:oxalate CoA-transferase
MLADFGARVIKIEPKAAGDIARAWGTPLPGGETAYFVSLHRNKQGIEVDLKRPEGKDLFFKLVERADVVLENYRTGALERLGLAYAEGRKRNPGIIYCSVSGFGQDGPYRDRAALDLILQAESGMISVTGEEGGRGVRAGTSIADMTAGMYAAFGIMLALRVKERTGRGQAIDVSMLEGQMSLLGTMIGGFLADGELPAPMGTAYKALLPYQTFRTKTRDLALAVGSEKLWQIFCPAIGRPELANDPRYAKLEDRVQEGRMRELIQICDRIFQTQPMQHWQRKLEEADVPYSIVATLDDVVADRQMAANDVFPELDDPVLGRVRTVDTPLKVEGHPKVTRTAAPRLGEHTRAILAELGFASPQVDLLIERQVVADRHAASAPVPGPA